MPLYPLFVTLSFSLFGLGIWQARLVSFVAGLGVIVLTFIFGRQLYNETVGLLAALVLSVVRLGVVSSQSGLPLADVARLIRYDILVPVWVLAACILFYWSHTKNLRFGYIITGIFVGLATLTHLYGFFIMPVLIAALLWQHGRQILGKAPAYLICLGWGVTMLPWLIYLFQDFVAYQGQMLRHQERFGLFDLNFYWTNLTHEYIRYRPWVNNEVGQRILWPRPGLWLIIATVPGALILLWRRTRRCGRMADQLLLLTLPLLSAGLALLLSLKRYPYLVLILPFLALFVAVMMEQVWRWASKRTRYVSIAAFVLLGLLTVESGLGIWHGWQRARATTSYQQLAQTLRQTLPLGSRLLMSQPYWLALADYETRSINLAFVLSDPQYHLTAMPSMAQTIRQIQPDYIVVERGFLEAYNQDPTQIDNPHAAQQWRTFGRYVDQYCPDLIKTIPTSDYDEIRIYQC